MRTLILLSLALTPILVDIAFGAVVQSRQEECDDIWSERKCWIKAIFKDQCGRRRVRRNCAQSCEECTGGEYPVCEDTMSPTRCQGGAARGKCEDRAGFAYKCRATCGFCDDDPVTEGPTEGPTDGPTEEPTTTTQGPTTAPGSCASMPSFMTNANKRSFETGAIVGGDAAPSPIPWQVALFWSGGQYCGGTILDSCTILSAAHCQVAVGETIRAGSTDKLSGGQYRTISQVISNNDLPYDSQATNNDWIIAKLSEPLDMGGDVQAACLPAAGYLEGAGADRCFTSGWGSTQSGGGTVQNLRYVRVPVITNAQCNNDYGGSITSSMICAGYPDVGGKDACQGDSGGPLVCNNNGQAVLTGVTSWGIGCARPDYPGVYARVTTVLDWITSNMGSCSG